MNRMPLPGLRAFEARAICDELARNVAVIAPQGLTNFDSVDSASVEFLLQLVKWERDPTGLRWAFVLSGVNDVCSAWRKAARELADARCVEGDEWKTA